MANYQTPWMCINDACEQVIGYVSGGELTPAEDVKPADITTRGANVAIRCPVCGTMKTWYASDPIVRMTNQLIEVIAESIAKRAIHTVNIKTK